MFSPTSKNEHLWKNPETSSLVNYLKDTYGQDSVDISLSLHTNGDQKDTSLGINTLRCINSYLRYMKNVSPEETREMMDKLLYSVKPGFDANDPAQAATAERLYRIKCLMAERSDSNVAKNDASTMGLICLCEAYEALAREFGYAEEDPDFAESMSIAKKGIKLHRVRKLILTNRFYVHHSEQDVTAEKLSAEEPAQAFLLDLYRAYEEATEGNISEDRVADLEKRARQFEHRS